MITIKDLYTKRLLLSFSSYVWPFRIWSLLHCLLWTRVQQFSSNYNLDVFQSVTFLFHIFASFTLMNSRDNPIQWILSLKRPNKRTAHYYNLNTKQKWPKRSKERKWTVDKFIANLSFLKDTFKTKLIL